MKHNSQPHGLRHCAGGRADRRGSAILLVLVSMVLMAILAGSLLQLTRFERIPRSESNIEVVIASVVDEILNQATDDLLNNSGNYLSPTYTASNANGGGDEPFDFPWTNSATYSRGIRQPENSNGVAQTNILGGLMDDTWLAAHMPDFRTAAERPTGSLYNGAATDTTNGVWRKITSLTGLYLGGTSGSADLSTVNSPNEYGVTNLANPLRSDTNINTTSTYLVDADGDGIGDSRWEWAPLRQVGATQYVMAVRIVDLSARMDVNVATGRFLTTTASASRGDSPIELDGNQFVADITPAASAATTQNEWREVLNLRLTGVLPNPTDVISGAQGTTYDNNSATPGPPTRRDLWVNGASRVSNTFDRHGEDPASATYNYDSGSTFGLTDAFELLQGNGLNSANSTTIEDLMPTFLRRNAGQEDGYAAGSGTNKPWTATKNFWELDPRKHVTVFAGSAISAKPANAGQDRELKLDVNEAVKTSTGRTALRDRIDTFLSSVGNLAALLNLYPHINNRVSLSDQLAANIADYIDDDNTVTTVGDKTGFEALPYITEIYTQRIYDGTVTVNGADATMSTIDWAADTTNDVVGYVIEIGNPFGRLDGTDWVGRPIRLDNVFLGIDGTTDTNDLASYAGKSTLEPGEVLIIYRNSTGDDNNNATEGTLSNYLSNTNNTGSTNITPVPATLTTEGPEMPKATAEFTVSLHAAEQDTTTALTWAYNACDINIGGTTLPQETFDSTHHVAATTYQTYVQTSYRGVGEGLQMMTVAADPSGTNGYHEDVSLIGSPQTNTTLPVATPNGPNVGAATRSLDTWFDNELKDSAPSGFSNLDGQQIIWPDSERERMHWIGDILQIPLIGPNDSSATDKTMANAFYRAAGNSSTLTNATTGNGIAALLLPYKVGTPTGRANISTGAGGLFGMYRFPHAMLLLEQLTTYSPATDGEDGDGQGGTETLATPNDDEVLVPGRLNLNTAPRDTLVRLLPFPDQPTREAIADAIIARRENNTQFTDYGSTGVNGIPGVFYTPVLFDQIESLLPNAGTSFPGNPSQDAADTHTLGSTRIDLNDHETALGTYVSPNDGVIDDREEELMLAKWLTEMCDTRSDVFAAYIVVQGYPIDNFSNGATESARLIVIFSRAGVKGSGDKAVEIGRFRIN